MRIRIYGWETEDEIHFFYVNRYGLVAVEDFFGDLVGAGISEETMREHRGIFWVGYL